jgi:hypothetical protein
MLRTFPTLTLSANSFRKIFEPGYAKHNSQQFPATAQSVRRDRYIPNVFVADEVHDQIFDMVTGSKRRASRLSGADGAQQSQRTTASEGVDEIDSNAPAPSNSASGSQDPAPLFSFDGVPKAMRRLRQLLEAQVGIQIMFFHNKLKFHEIVKIDV